MKFSPDLVEALAARVRVHDTAERREFYLSGRFPRAGVVRDLDRRYRWDLFYLAAPWDVIDAVADDVADAHIDTVLRRVVPSLTAVSGGAA